MPLRNFTKIENTNTVMRFSVKDLYLMSILTFFVNNAFTQDFDSDLINALNNKFEYPQKSNIQFPFFSEKKVFKYNPVYLAFGGLLFSYQKLISPQISASCSYEINCSNFSKLSIKKFGLIKGIALTSDRLTRCTKLASYDIHPLSINEYDKIIDHPDNYIISK